MRMPVIRRVARRKDHRAVENRENSLHAAAPVAVPQLEMAAVLLAPVLVEVDQHVEPPIQLQFGMDVEVGVDFEEAAGLDLMQAAAAEIWIGDQPIDARERLQPE